MLQRTDDWYAARLGLVTGSRVADVMRKTKSGPAASRKNYMAQLICERLTGVPTSMYQYAEMQWGTDNEPLARSAYEADTFNLVLETGFVPHPKIKGFGASPDGLVSDKGLVEIKCPNTATHIHTLVTSTFDNDYLIQMHAQMMCTGREWCDFVSFDPRLPDDKALYIDRIQIRKALIDEIETEVKSFLAELEATIDKLFELRPAGREAYIERWRS